VTHAAPNIRIGLTCNTCPLRRFENSVASSLSPATGCTATTRRHIITSSALPQLTTLESFLLPHFLPFPGHTHTLAVQDGFYIKLQPVLRCARTAGATARQSKCLRRRQHRIDIESRRQELAPWRHRGYAGDGRLSTRSQVELDDDQGKSIFQTYSNHG
jgi:hypothetical protein